MSEDIHRMNRFVGAVILSLWLGLTAGFALAQQDSPAGDIGRGVKAWSENCARCHNMRDPKEFRDDQWKVIVTHMRVRGGLTGQEARDILEYLQSAN